MSTRTKVVIVVDVECDSALKGLDLNNYVVKVFSKAGRKEIEVKRIRSIRSSEYYARPDPKKT